MQLNLLEVTKAECAIRHGHTAKCTEILGEVRYLYPDDFERYEGAIARLPHSAAAPEGERRGDGSYRSAQSWSSGTHSWTPDAQWNQYRASERTVDPFPHSHLLRRQIGQCGRELDPREIDLILHNSLD